MVKKEEKELKKNKNEAWMRIPIGIVSGTIIYVWAYLIALFFLINFIYRIFTGKILKELVEMSNVWIMQNYVFLRYMTFNTDERPFPFSELKKEK